MTNVAIKWELINFKHNMDNKKTYEIWLAFLSNYARSSLSQTKLSPMDRLF